MLAILSLWAKVWLFAQRSPSGWYVLCYFLRSVSRL